MKFDVIIGNPPYQGTSGTQTGQTIWDKIVEVSLEHVKPDGLLTFIHPGRWRQADDKLSYMYKDYQLVYLSIHSVKDGQKTFGASTNYDVYMIRKVPPQENTYIRFMDGTVGKYHVNRLPFIPNTMMDFWIKAFNTQGPYLKVYQSGTHTPAHKHMSPVPTPEHVYPIVHRMGEELEMFYSTKPHKHQGEPKIIFRDQGKNWAQINTSGCANHTYYVLDDSPALLDFFLSDRYKEIAQSVTFGHRQVPYKPLCYLPLSILTDVQS